MTKRKRNQSSMLYDQQGNRKYLTAEERRAFIKGCSASRTGDWDVLFDARVYRWTHFGDLALTPRRIDYSVRGITIGSMKKRRRGVFRTVPISQLLLEVLDAVHGVRVAQSDAIHCDQRLWTFGRTTAWMRVKQIMRKAGISGVWGVPKGLRHGLGVEGTAEANIPLGIIQKWLGHSRIETTAIYANAVGREGRMLAERIWPT